MEKLEKVYSDILWNTSTLELENGSFAFRCGALISGITRQVAIDFALWQQRGECNWVLNDEDEWIDSYAGTRITTEELFDEFLKIYEI